MGRRAHYHLTGPGVAANSFAVSTGAPGSDERLPRRFGRYLLFDRIGEGGMAQIYLGRTRNDLGGERLVVVKEILPLFSDSAEFARLLIDEAKLAARLSHGNVVQVFDLGREEDRLYIAMEYVEGFDLRQLLLYCSRGGVPLPVEFALLVVCETLRALDYAHRKKDDDGRPLGIVHRDVSPSNVLLSFDGEVKLCDFGIARAIGATAELPAEAIQGKAGYMSPEAARGDPIDARSDVFSLGVILWELLAGRRAYGKSATIEQARQGEIPALPERGHPDEATLHAIVDKAIVSDPAARYASARDMLRDLDEYVRRTHLVASPLVFGEWLLEHFGNEILEFRKARERAAQALEHEPHVAVPSAAGVAATEALTSARPPATEKKPNAVWMLVAAVVVAAAIASAFLFR